VCVCVVCVCVCVCVCVSVYRTVSPHSMRRVSSQGDQGDAGQEATEGDRGEMGLRGKDGPSGPPGLVGVRVRVSSFPHEEEALFVQLPKNTCLICSSSARVRKVNLVFLVKEENQEKRFVPFSLGSLLCCSILHEHVK